MAETDLDRFCEAVLDDSELQARLKILTDRDEFIDRVVELAAELGRAVPRAAIEDKMRENSRLWHERWI